MVIALAIPLCLFISMTVMFFAGDTLNMTSILGLVICVGLLVDNSVVVAENIHRHYQSGPSWREACLRGVGEIGLAVTTATLTTIIVFLPFAVRGRRNAFHAVYQLALPVVSALLASLGTAIIFIPAVRLPDGGHHAPGNGPTNAQEGSHKEGAHSDLRLDI